jgi:hypothetical protein
MIFLLAFWLISFHLALAGELKALGVVTGPPQWLWSYYIYKVEFIALPPGQRNLAGGCVGPGGRICKCFYIISQHNFDTV